MPENDPETGVEETARIESGPPARPSRRRVLYIFLAYLLALLLVGGVAYAQGRGMNRNLIDDEVSRALLEQYELGVADLEAGRYENARQRFEAIIRYDPTYPGVEDLLVEALVNTNVPTVTPPAAPTATPDPSPPEDLFTQAEAALSASDWTLAITKLLALRGKDSGYQSVRVDGMMYVALRYRGMELISGGEMEEGLYNLSLAQRFGPLDRDAMFRESLAQQYLLANSYLGLNWGRAAELFGPLCDQGATVDSCSKYGDAAWKYGDQLWDAGDPCAAQEQYGGSLDAWPHPEVEPTATKAAKACAEASAPPPPPPATMTPTPTLTPTPDGSGGGNGG